MNKILIGLSTLLIASCSVQKLPVTIPSYAPSGNYVQDASDKLFRNFHGLVTSPTRVDMDGEGVHIYVERLDMDTTKKSIYKIKQRYVPDGEFINIGVGQPKLPGRVIMDGRGITSDFSSTILLFAIPVKDSGIVVVHCESAFLLDFNKAGIYANAIAKNGVPSYVFTDTTANVVDFAGREVELGNICGWQSPNHVSCPGLGDIEWSLYNTESDAKFASDVKVAILNVYMPEQLSQEDNLPVSLDGFMAKATRAIYRAPANDQGHEKLIYYLVNGKVRGHYVFAVISFYADEATEDGLSPLAAKILQP